MHIAGGDRAATQRRKNNATHTHTHIRIDQLQPKVNNEETTTRTIWTYTVYKFYFSCIFLLFFFSSSSGHARMAAAS
jgi:hypothetical protein